MMRQAIRINEKPKEEKVLKPIEFTHFIGNGWTVCNAQPDEYEKIVYLGKDYEDGDLFSAHISNRITIYKGHLNDGVY